MAIEPYKDKPLVQVDKFLEERIADSGIELDSGQAHALKRFTSGLATSVHYSIVMKCKGEGDSAGDNACPILNICPLKNSGIPLPLGNTCPFEAALMDKIINDFIDGLEIDVNSPQGRMDIMLAMEIARSEIIEMRANAQMSKRPEPVRREVTAINNNGDQVWSDVIAQELVIIEKWSKMKNKIRQELISTRRSQVQAGKDISDMTKQNAALMKRAKKALEVAQKRLESTNTRYEYEEGDEED